jgi:hypothetical protein
MAVIPSQAGQSPIYDEQRGKVAHWDTGARFEINGVAVGLAVTITPASGAANVCNITMQVQDLNSVNCATVFDLSVWLSDAATGAGLTAVTASGGLAVTTGTQLLAKVAAKALDTLTDATGKMVFSITDTAKTGFFVCVIVPGTGLVFVSAQLITANYG